MTTRIVSLLGLGFGDCGKGLFTDFLCRHWQAHTVVRFNGGAQAGHNVVLPDGRHHTFSQFCAGSFVPGVVTLLASTVIVHPTALLVENSYLQRVGVADALQRIIIDARCRVTTPFHQAAGRMRELARGGTGHGSCGVGVGETVAHGLEYPDQILHYGDLFDARFCLQQLELIRSTLAAQFEQFAGHCPAPENQAAYSREWQMLQDTGISQRWMQSLGALLAQVPAATHEQVSVRLQQAGTVLFEGAQGVLLDEWYGFHPHTTWSSINCAAVAAVCADAGHSGPIQHLGILRSYPTRHGSGPMPTHDSGLDHLAEPHNHGDGWQGVFRRGHPDAVLLRYALRAVEGAADAGADANAADGMNSGLDGLLLSHLDVFDKVAGLRWCYGYQGLDGDLPVKHGQDLAHQARLTALLNQAEPLYEGDLLTTAPALIQRLESLSNLPVLFGSYGPTHADVRMR